MTNHQILFDKLIYIVREAVATKADIADVTLRLAQLENRLLVRIGGMIALATAILIGVKYL